MAESKNAHLVGKTLRIYNESFCGHLNDLHKGGFQDRKISGVYGEDSKQPRLPLEKPLSIDGQQVDVVKVSSTWMNRVVAGTAEFEFGTTPVFCTILD